jgi:flavin-binding protein dodecin
MRPERGCNRSAAAAVAAFHGTWERGRMSDNVYKIIELVGSSSTSIEDAIEGAIARASTSLREIRWFEVKETRGHVENGKVAHFQVTLRVGFTLEG